VIWLLLFAIVTAVVWAVGIVADVLVGRRLRVPEKWAVHIPGRYPAYVRQDFARARQAMARARARALSKERTP